MIDLDFKKIRNHNGSQNKGFEELICQLAHLSPPETAEYFIRKGDGSDAGIECYWKLKGGFEYGWQSKYFLEPLKKPQWDQILESVKRALKNHPNLIRYYICLPRDLSDGRSRKSKKVKSEKDGWEENKKKWEKICADLNMKVEFILSGKHEISLLLQRDEPRFSGRAYYWFDAPILTSDVFYKLTMRSRHSLGEKYTPDQNVVLPVIKVFEGLGKTKTWWHDLKEQINNWENAIKISGKTIVSIMHKFPESNLSYFEDEIKNLSSDLIDGLDNKIFLIHIDKYRDRLNILMKELSLLTDLLLNTTNKETEEKKEQFRSHLISFKSKTNELLDYLNNNVCKVSQTRGVLLVGEAGVGKSHLLCDVSMKRLDNELPTIFLLGQHYEGGNPIEFLKGSMDLKNLNNQTFLGVLDAAGEAKETNTLIIIDAINEGKHRDDWEYHLGTLINDVLCYPNISLVLSCRSTFVNYLVSEDFVGNPLIKIIHRGFSGFEHRAASQFLSAQGISKPSAPITAPEFTNPLFLKTCCRALKSNGQSSFPKGLHGIKKIFEFYVDSMEKVVINKKRYRIGDNIVNAALNDFATALYPEYLSGLPIKTARKLINDCDPNPHHGDPLFDVLIQEGLLSEDFELNNGTQGKQSVVRFTYERFSDYFIAKHIAKDFIFDSLNHMFRTGSLFEQFFKDGKFYRKMGILSALSILIAEEWKKELIDLIPEDAAKDPWLFEEIFTNTLMWRTGESFSARTLALFNKISECGYFSPTLNIIIAISTEPLHPWNADFLHKHLVSLGMAQRDSFWSVHTATSDSEEGDNEKESAIRTIINWAYSGNMDQVEPERIRLCAIALIWMTSSPNRKVRDQATKAAVRSLSLFPEYLETILENFYGVDDIYVFERLFAVAYGVIANINNEKVIQAVANFSSDKIFSSGHPIPSMLLRDYCIGIIELAFVRGLFDNETYIKVRKVPFQSEWPLQYPTDEELEKLINETGAFRIKSSIFEGDFGTYTMQCVSDWSITSIKYDKPRTSYELKCEFADSLREDLKERYLTLLKTELDENKKLNDLYKLLSKNNVLIESLKNIIATKEVREIKESTKNESLLKEIEISLTPEQKEYFKWLIRFKEPKTIISFDKDKAQRWVCKKAIEIGWTKKLFDEFDRYYTSYRNTGFERMGKKYQWIALREFCARLSDNCCYIDPGYSDVDYSKYFGPWQNHLRDIDPTFLLKKTGDDGWTSWDKKFWWQPFVYSFGGTTLEELQNWLWNESIIPPFEDLVQVQGLSQNSSYYVLRSFANWDKEVKLVNGEVIRQNAWYRINTCIVHKDQASLLESTLQGENLCDPHFLEPTSTQSRGFFREYPWHTVYKDMKDWRDDINNHDKLNIKYLVPTSIYEWEANNKDKSIENSIRIYLPSKELIEAFNLSHDLNAFGKWVNEKNECIFFDPSVMEEGPSYGLVSSKQFLTWLEENDLQLIWIIGGEKQLFCSKTSRFYGRSIYSGILKLSNTGEKSKNIWYIKKPE